MAVWEGRGIWQWSVMGAPVGDNGEKEGQLLQWLREQPGEASPLAHTSLTKCTGPCAALQS